MVVDVHGDQHAGDHDERDQQDAEDEADVQGLVRAWDPVHGAVGRHHWRTKGNTDNQRSWQQERVTLRNSCSNRELSHLLVSEIHKHLQDGHLSAADLFFYLLFFIFF